MNKILSLVSVVVFAVAFMACGEAPADFAYDSVYSVELTTVETTCTYGQKGASHTVTLQPRIVGSTFLVDIIDERGNIDTFVGTHDGDSFDVEYLVNAAGTLVNNQLRGRNFSTNPTVDLAQHITANTQDCRILSAGDAQ